MEGIQINRHHCSSLSSSDRDHSEQKRNRAERSLKKKRSHKSRKCFSSPDKGGRFSSSRRKRSRSISLKINTLYISSSEDSDSDMGSREWLPSSSKYVDNPSRGCSKTRCPRYDSPDVDTPVKKDVRTDYRKVRSRSSSGSESASPIQHTKPVNNGRRSSSTSRSFSSSEIKFSTAYRSCSSSKFSSSQVLVETKHREASPTENIRYPDKGGRFSSSRRNRSPSISIKINTLYRSSSGDSDSDMGRREWLPSSSKYVDNTSHGCRKAKHGEASSTENICYPEFTGKTSSSSSSEKKSHSRSNEKKRPNGSSGKTSYTRPIEKKSTYKGNGDERCTVIPDKATTMEDNTSRRREQVSDLKRKHNKRDRDEMAVEVTVKRKRSSGGPSPRNSTNECDDFENVEQLPKRRRPNEYDNSKQADSNKNSTKNTVSSTAVRPATSPPDTHQDKPGCQFQTDGQSNHKYKQRYRRDDLSLHNCCAHSDEAESKFKERYGGADVKHLSAVYEGKDQSGSTSGHPHYSPQLVTSKTPSGYHVEGSSRFSSPSFINNLSPKSTLKGLDQPHPWALDLLARSRTYNRTFIDSHCHIDLLYDRLGLSHSTRFSEFRKMVAHSFPGNFEGCVAVFCYPKTYDPINPQNQLFATLAQEDGVWFAIGCHPKNATEFTARHEQGLRKALRQSKVVALGEMGLDYSGTFHRHAETQKSVLRKQLQIALEMSLPLVLHCRDAYDDCLAILKEMVPRSWPMHLHCFCGSPDTANIWLKTFPNLYIGLTPVITYKTAHGSINTARNIPLNRLLLETDSPYFVPGNIPKDRSSVAHPGFALFTAERIAELKKVPVDTVLQACRRNTTNVYGI